MERLKTPHERGGQGGALTGQGAGAGTLANLTPCFEKLFLRVAMVAIVCVA
jgi:hypothetical protein